MYRPEANMSDDGKGPRPNDTHEKEYEEAPSDPRLIPGGAKGAPVDVGMSGMDRDDVPSEALPPRVEHFGDSPRSE
jgi:hypothetical protein